jgi:hypothetical protein
LASLALRAGVAHAADAARLVEFNRDVRPILSDNCFKCHGPDKQRSGLRLDVAEIPIEKKAIVPGDPAASNMIKRVTSSDPKFQMPPPDITPRPTPEQIQTLHAWITQGAKYARHWAFEPVPPARAPEVADAVGWIRNPIDAFVLRKLNEAALQPEREASRARLLRRVTLDLTGLPPTLEEIEAFEKDRSGGAYEKAVDRLLGSPAYGEHMATGWLDLARYADTFGYQDDKPNQVWPWRDWVIRAFNENLPYSDFVRWQLAGDLLPSPTQDQRLATAFNRLHRQTNEGGSINEEFLVEYAADRTKTFGMAFLGVTLECARCHDHKFDPISQRDYYSVLSFFSNIDESGMYSFFTDATPTPSTFLYAPGQAEEHARLKKALRDAEMQAMEARREAETRIDRARLPAEGAIDLPAPIARFAFDSITNDKTPNLVPGGEAAAVSGDVSLVPGKQDMAAHFSGENSIAIADGVNFERTDPFSIALWVRPGAGTERMVVLHHSAASMDAASRGYELMIDQGHVVFGLNHFWPGDAIRVRTTGKISPKAWTHIAVTYDGSSHAEGARLYLNGAAAPVEILRDHLYQTIRYERGGPYALTIGARFRDPGFKDGAVDDVYVFDTCLTALEVPLTMGGPAGPRNGETERIDHHVRRKDDVYRHALESLHAAREAEAKFADSLSEIMVMQELPKTPSAHVLARGAYDAPRDEVGPDTPAKILAFPPEYPRNRLGLAEWLLRRDHPLTSRVEVNRVWKQFFGRGLVATLEDFGSQGSPPSNQDLLDYLAAWFMDSGWDVKALCKLIVTSAAYRQDSAPVPALVARDPENVLLARGPRMRLSAEEVRDAALAASGLLVRSVGGPSVKPYQPGDLWKDASQISYEQDKGDALYRRSLYTYLKRTVPPPMMTTFDTADRETCVARRETTTTPLQALVLLNDTQFVEAARVLAEDAMTGHRGEAKAIVVAFRRLIGRAPTDREKKILKETFDEQRAIFAAAPDEATAYTKLGERPVRDGVDRVKLAAMTAVVQLIMNFDEFQVKS